MSAWAHLPSAEVDFNDIDDDFHLDRWKVSVWPHPLMQLYDGESGIVLARLCRHDKYVVTWKTWAPVARFTCDA